MNNWLDAAFWIGLSLIASMISVRLGISVAMVEITDLGTVLALGVLFAHFSVKLLNKTCQVQHSNCQGMSITALPNLSTLTNASRFLCLSSFFRSPSGT